MQKICIISFDNWQYDKFIVQKLLNRGFEAYHVDLGGFKHANMWTRIVNLCSKIFLNKNLKKEKKQEYILETLSQKDFQDQILVINPDVIELKYHLQIRKFTAVYNAFLYDSVQRCPIEHLLQNNLFDAVYSFDDADCEQFGFIKSHNFVYFDKQIPSEKPKYKLVTVSSFDKRFSVFNKIAYQLQNKKIPFEFIFVSRNITFKTIKYNFKIAFGILEGKKINSKIHFQSKKISIKSMLKQYQNAEIILDVVQGSQTGLSFRVFEAMGMQKKLITDNQAIKKYDFYNQNNILVIDRKNPVITDNFLATAYEPIHSSIYQKYTLDSWVEQVFKI